MHEVWPDRAVAQAVLDEGKGLARTERCARAELARALVGWSMEYRGKVGAWLRRALYWLGGQGEALPLPAGGGRERQLGQHDVLA